MSREDSSIRCSRRMPGGGYSRVHHLHGGSESEAVLADGLPGGWGGGEEGAASTDATLRRIGPDMPEARCQRAL